MKLARKVGSATPLLAVALSSCLFHPALAQAPTPDAPADADLEVYSAPRLDRFKADAYPASELREQGEGWVVVNFMVDPAGKPYEIGVVESMGGPAFERAALRSVAASRFLPARLGDKAIDAGLLLKITFAQGNAKGARSSYISGHRKLVEAIEADDRAAADAVLVSLKPENLYEAAYFNLTMYAYHRRWGTEGQQMEALQGAVAGEDRPNYLPRAEFVAVMGELLKRQIARNDLGAALETWRKLELVLKAEEKSQWAPVIAEVRRIQRLDSPVPLKGEIARSGSWFDHLFRHRFRVVVHSGHVSDIKLRCDKSYLLFRYDPALEYTVKGRDDRCVIELVGEPGTRFTLVQT